MNVEQQKSEKHHGEDAGGTVPPRLDRSNRSRHSTHNEP
jgi:hypothetical protein